MTRPSPRIRKLARTVSRRLAGLRHGEETAGELEEGPRRKLGFTIAVIALGAEAARRGAPMDEADFRDFGKRFTIPARDRAHLERGFKVALSHRSGFRAYARRAARLLRGRPEIRSELLDCLLYLAAADGPMRPAERAYIGEIAEIFGLSPQEFEALAAPYDGRRDSPYRILGLERGVSEAAARQRYRDLIREHHPDILTAKGMPQELVDLATLKLARVNDAYRELKSRWEDL
jgi:DnaJ like chaperone protein